MKQTEVLGAKRILIVDDDPDMIEVLSINLQRAGYQVDSADSGGRGIGLALMNPYDLLILDLKLPDVDGLQVCKALRGNERHTPIMMLTSRKSEPQKIAGFESGADDYMTKPFSMGELLARVKALIRRVEMTAAPAERKKMLRVGEIAIDLEKRAVVCGGNAVELTATEFDLLVFLASRPGRAFSREELLQHVWGYSYEGYENTVNVHINRLRAKIEKEPGSPRYILTVWGIGYRFAEHQEVEGHGKLCAAERR